MGSITFRRNKNGTFCFRARYNKHQKQVSKTFSTKEEAVSWLESLGDGVNTRMQQDWELRFESTLALINKKLDQISTKLGV